MCHLKVHFRCPGVAIFIFVKWTRQLPTLLLRCPPLVRNLSHVYPFHSFHISQGVLYTFAPPWPHRIFVLERNLCASTFIQAVPETFHSTS